jgi:hypothetical protein
MPHEINSRIVERIGMVSRAHTNLVRAKVSSKSIPGEVFDAACVALEELIEILEREGPPEYEFLITASRGAAHRLSQHKTVDWDKVFNVVPDGDMQELLCQDMVRQGSIDPDLPEVHPTRFERDPVI